MTKYYLIDFFCGCGGTSLGFEQAGWDIAMGIDIDKKASESYQENFGNASFINRDITKLKEPEFIEKLEKTCPDWKPKTRKEKDIKIAFSLCSPCQPFSTNNRNRLNKNDSRLNLLDACIKFIDLIKPDFIFLENVPGMKLDKEIGPFSGFLQYLDKKNYKYPSPKIINASHYGVPQNRKRLVLIAGKRNEEITYPETTHAKDDLIKKPFVTVQDTIHYLPSVKAGEKSKYHDLHESRKLSPENLTCMESTSPDGGNRFEWEWDLWKPCHIKLNNPTIENGKIKKDKNGRPEMEKSGWGGVYGRMWWKEQPAPTLSTKFTAISCGRFGHPEQHRAITLLEGALLQSFPADKKKLKKNEKEFIFKGTFEDIARQIGNAVPPKLARVFAEYFKEIDK